MPRMLAHMPAAMLAKKQMGSKSKMKRVHGSRANLLNPRTRYARATSLGFRPSSMLPQLSHDEKEFFRIVQSGDIDRVNDFLEGVHHFNINCQDFQGYTGLILAIKNEDMAMVDFLLQYDSLVLGDALLHAILTGNLEIVERLIQCQRHYGSEMSLPPEVESAEFTEDITPLILAAHCEHYDIIKLLLLRGHTIEKPHPPSCFCKEKCQFRKKGETLSCSKARYNAYKALSSPAYMCQVASDPILASFHLSKELALCAEVEREFRAEYEELSRRCSNFAVELLNQCRTTEEVELVLNQPEGFYLDDKEKLAKFARVRLAIDCEQKKFVAHPNAQQVMRAAWLGEWQDWRQLSFWTKTFRLLPRMLLLPVMALVYWVAPFSNFTKSWRSPVNKFFNFAASYVFFLVMLSAQNYSDLKTVSRGAPQTGLEWLIALYVIGLVWRSMKQMWVQGMHHYFSQKWHWYDLCMCTFFLVSFACWFWAEYDVWENDDRYLPRKFWHQYDPTLIAEGLYATAVIFAFGKVMYFFQIGNTLGPLQISISRMFMDIASFLTMFLVILVSFGIGMHKLYHYYKGQVRHLNGFETRQSSAFVSLPASISTLFWALFGLSPPYYADVVVSEHYKTVGNATVVVINKHKFTEAMGFILFGVYNIAAVIILVNMLIAMMSTSFLTVQNNADTEWKFTRTQVWMNYFEEGGTLPPPFNLVPSPKSIFYLIRWTVYFFSGDKNAKCSFLRCCYHGQEEIATEEEQGIYQMLMAQLVQRYLSHTEYKHDRHLVTSADLDLVRHDLNNLKHLSQQVLDTVIAALEQPSHTSV